MAIVDCKELSFNEGEERIGNPSEKTPKDQKDQRKQGFWKTEAQRPSSKTCAQSHRSYGQSFGM